jgi:TRAP-type C4-dicarboxylate transport system permease small subunit
MHSSTRFIRYVINALLVISGIAVIGMTGIIVANVIGRMFFKSPVFGVTELAGFCGVVLVAIGIGLTEREHRNVIVEVLVNRFPPRMKAFADVFVLFLSFGIVACLFYANFDNALKSTITGAKTFTLGINPAPFEFTWAIGLFILCLFLLRNIIDVFIKGLKR